MAKEVKPLRKLSDALELPGNAPEPTSAPVVASEGEPTGRDPLAAIRKRTKKTTPNVVPRIIAYLDESTEALVRDIAAKNNVSASAIVKLALEDWLKRNGYV